MKLSITSGDSNDQRFPGISLIQKTPQYTLTLLPLTEVKTGFYLTLNSNPFHNFML